MTGSIVDRGHFKAAGIVVALLGFFLTRLAVAEVYNFDASLAEFAVTGAIPLLLGLGLAIFGVGLAVSTLSRQFVRTVTTWSLLGAVAMAIVAALSVFDGRSVVVDGPTGTMLTNVVLGGAVGGAGIGILSARRHEQRAQLAHHADRSTLINRLLRHEVLNAVTIVRGYADLVRDAGEQSATDAAAAIADESHRIESAIESVEFLTEGVDKSGPTTLDIGAIVDAEVDRLREAYPAADVRLRDVPSDDVEVIAPRQLDTVVANVLENAVVHGGAPYETDEDRDVGAGTTVWVDVRVDRGRATVRVADDGPGLDPEVRDQLERRTLPVYDDPTTGFGLTIGRILVERAGGSISVVEDDPDAGGAVLDLYLPRPPHGDPDRTTSHRYGVTTRNVWIAVGAAIVAGTVMGAAMQFVPQYVPAIGGAYGDPDMMPVIGALYGGENVLVGWTTHLFHSVVFGLLFAGFLAQPALEAYDDDLLRAGMVGLVWGIVLWLVAAGVIMPVWLSVVGVELGVPFLSALSLVGHAIWGIVLGTTYAFVVSRLD